MKNKFSTLIGSSVLATGLAVTSSFFAASAQAYTLTLDPNCAIAADVFNPQYDNCKGAYLLDNGENDVTDGEADNIVNQLLNVEDIFGDPDWTFLGKQDSPTANQYFTVNGIDSTTGDIVFDIAAIEADFGPTFIEDYDIAISFKAAKNFSIYQWDAALGTNIIEWSTAGTATNNGGTVQDLSHASVYFRKKDPVVEKVPEPASLVGLGLVATGMVIARRRKFDNN